jgi:hypothetical protein
MIDFAKVDARWKSALAEICEIEPWFRKGDNVWVYSHEDFNVEGSGLDYQECVESYKENLYAFLIAQAEKGEG